jgi:hypothetical protein
LVECYKFRVPERSVRTFEAARECAPLALYAFVLGHIHFFVSSD